MTGSPYDIAYLGFFKSSQLSSQVFAKHGFACVKCVGIFFYHLEYAIKLKTYRSKNALLRSDLY